MLLFIEEQVGNKILQLVGQFPTCCSLFRKLGVGTLCCVETLRKVKTRGNKTLLSDSTTDSLVFFPPKFRRGRIEVKPLRSLKATNKRKRKKEKEEHSPLETAGGDTRLH